MVKYNILAALLFALLLMVMTNLTGAQQHKPAQAIADDNLVTANARGRVQEGPGPLLPGP
jgi:hypothetical protein